MCSGQRASCCHRTFLVKELSFLCWGVRSCVVRLLSVPRRVYGAVRCCQKYLATDLSMLLQNLLWLYYWHNAAPIVGHRDLYSGVAKSCRTSQKSLQNRGWQPTRAGCSRSCAPDGETHYLHSHAPATPPPALSIWRENPGAYAGKHEDERITTEV